MTYESRNGLMLGAAEKFHDQHQVSGDTSLALGRLSTVLEWSTDEHNTSQTGPFMSSSIVRGEPYTSMLYLGATPKITALRPITFPPTVDNTDENKMECGTGSGNYGPAKLVNKEIRVHFDQSDFTWLIFVSEPTSFQCWTENDPFDPNLSPGVVTEGAKIGGFELRATTPMKYGMVRLAIGNNCTTGQNAECKSPVSLID